MFIKDTSRISSRGKSSYDTYYEQKKKVPIGEISKKSIDFCTETDMLADLVLKIIKYISIKR